MLELIAELLLPLLAALLALAVGVGVFLVVWRLPRLVAQLGIWAPRPPSPPRPMPRSIDEICHAVACQLEDTGGRTAFVSDLELEVHVQRGMLASWYLSINGRLTPHESLEDLMVVLRLRLPMERVRAERGAR